MLVILVFLVFVWTSRIESAVQIRNVETQAGYAVLQGEPLSIVAGFSELIHIINIDDIEDTIGKLKLGVSQNFKVNDGWLLISLNKKINQVEHSLRTLRVHTRNKRALVNIGGYHIY